MAYTIQPINVMCRIERNVALYDKPTDIKPNNLKLLLSGTIFISTAMINVGNVTLYRIDSFVSDPLENLTGYWCPNSMLTINYIETEIENIENLTCDDQTDINKTLVVTGNNIIIYKTSESHDIIKHDIDLGERLVCNRMVHVNYNGTTETRYQIDMDDNDLTGYWILVNSSVSELNSSSIYRTSFRSAPVTYAAAPTTVTPKPKDNASKTDKKEEHGGSPGSFDTPAGGESTYDTTVSEEEEDLSEDELYNILNVSLDDEELYKKYGFNYKYSTITHIMNVPLGRLLFVHGMPFQFTYITDRRGGAINNYGKVDEPADNKVTSGDADLYGRIFAKEIVANMPIAVITPGKAEFLTRVRKSVLGYSIGSSQSAKNNWLPLFSDGVTSEQEEAAIKDLMSDKKGADYDYFSFVIDTDEYYKYVNALCRTSARLMGLGNETYRGKKCTRFDWGGYNTAAEQDYTTMQEVVGLANSVSFAFDPLSAISDTISNSTGDSQFTSMFNGYSAKARELNFISGATTANDIGIGSGEEFQAAVDAATGNGVIGKWGTPFRRFGSWLLNVGSGLNIRFPEIWQDSSNSRSYDMDMRFITPYATMFCKWRYVLVPFFHIFALAAPQSPNSIMVYKSPFLIRAFSKGYFNVEMGIIESLTWKRFGDGDMISADGVPTQIDVSIGFKDLYHTLTMSKTSDVLDGVDSIDNIKVFFNNTGLMDLIGTLSGVNMNRITFGERMALYTGAVGSTFSSTGPNFMRHFSDRVRNVVERYFIGI